MTVLPRRPGRRRTVADSHRTHTPPVCWTECPVAVADQVAWCFIPRESLGYVSGDPFGGRMSRDIKPYQSPPLMTQDHQTIEQFKKCGRHDEEVDRSNPRCMVA